MNHSYLSRRDIYFASSQKQITTKESRELISIVDNYSKKQKSDEKKKKDTFIIR